MRPAIPRTGLQSRREIRKPGGTGLMGSGGELSGLIANVLSGAEFPRLVKLLKPPCGRVHEYTQDLET